MIVKSSARTSADSSAVGDGLLYDPSRPPTEASPLWTQTRAIAEAWGWRKQPSEAALLMAERAALIHSDMLDVLLVGLGSISTERLEDLRKKRPAKMSLLRWLMQQEPKVAALSDQLIALEGGHAYYESLASLAPSSQMGDPQVLKRCDELDAVLVMVEDAHVLVFSSYDHLSRFESLGREERASDRIVRAIGTDPFSALSDAEEVSSLINRFKSSDQEVVEVHSTTVLSAASLAATNRPEAREIGRLFEHALAQRATDIAIKPMRNGSVQILMRKHGEMVAPKAVPGYASPELAQKMVQLLLSRSGANPTSTRVREPRDGQITWQSPSGDVFMRLNFIPLNHLGEERDLISVSIRLLPTAQSTLVLADLGLHPTAVEETKFAVQMTQGLILVAGPTNSGKSTTVAGGLCEHVRLFGDRRKRLSVEDPVERHLPGVIQINVPTHIADEKRRFGVILPAIKRHDPDVIWIGEIRDTSTADLCVSSASSGHMVLSTIHANDSVLAYDVLSKMVSADLRFQLIESMSLTLSQRLIPRVCKHCRTVGEPTDEERSSFDAYLERIGERAELPKTVARANPAGCEHCDGGISGVIPVNETLPFSRAVKDACMQMAEGKDMRKVIAGKRTLTLLQSSLARLEALQTDVPSIFI